MRYTLLSVSPDGSGDVLLRVRSLTDGTEGRVRRVLAALEDYREVGSPTSGAILFPEDAAILFRKSDRTSAIERAYTVLAAGDNSAAALRRKLTERGFLPDVAAFAVEYMQEKGYLDESDACRRYAVQWAEKRLFGKRRILAELLRKGYPRDTATEAIAAAEDAGDIDFALVKEGLLATLPEGTPDEKRRALLYKNGF